MLVRCTISNNVIYKEHVAAKQLLSLIVNWFSNGKSKLVRLKIEASLYQEFRWLVCTRCTCIC